MLFRIKLLLLITFLTISCGKEQKKNEGLQILETKSNFIDLEGKAVEISDFRGKRVLVNYWATWCIPCLKEFPSLVRSQELMSKENFVFLFPSPDSADKIKKFKKDKNYPLQYLTLNSTLDKLNIYALPATFIYTSEGKVFKRIDGATEWDSPEIVEMLKSVP